MDGCMPLIKLYANLRKLAGTIEIETNAGQLGAAIEDLLAKKQALAGLILENGKPRAHIVITINGQLTSDLALPLAPGDVVAIFPPIAGG